jgi:hypothetical protein
VGKLYRSKRDNRRNQRIPCLGAARIYWEDERGLGRYAQAKYVDISEEGLCIEVAEQIPVRSTLLLRAESISVSCSATVRYVAWRRCKHILGLNLSQALAKDSLNLAALQSSLDRHRRDRELTRDNQDLPQDLNLSAPSPAVSVPKPDALIQKEPEAQPEMDIRQYVARRAHSWIARSAEWNRRG